MTSYGGHAPLVNFLVTAWVSTMHGFSDVVSVQSCSFKDLVKNACVWEHKWLNFGTGVEQQVQ